MAKTRSEQIGSVGVDSGTLMLCDPCYLPDTQQTDGEWNREKGSTPAVAEEYRPKHYNPDDYNFSTWELFEALAGGHRPSVQLHYRLGHPGAGVAFRTQAGDGMFPVFAVYDEYGVLIRVEVRFQ